MTPEKLPDYDIDAARERDTWLVDAARHPQHVYNDLLSRRVVLGHFLRECLHNRRFRIVVDIGGGEGIWSERLQHICDRVIVLDISLAMLSYARQKDLRQGSFLVGNAEKIPLESRAADGVLMFEILQLIGDPSTAFQEAARILVSGGWLLCSFSNRDYVDFFSKRVIHREKAVRFYTLSEVEELLEEAGFTIISRRFIWLVGNSWVGWFRRVSAIRRLIPIYYKYVAQPMELLLARGPSRLKRAVFRTIFILAELRPAKVAQKLAAFVLVMHHAQSWLIG